MDIFLITFLLFQLYNTLFRNKFNQASIKRIHPGKIKVKFSDFEGMDEVKREIKEYVDFLKQNDEY